MAQDDSNRPHPFLKWAGGKSQMLKQYERLLPRNFNRYYEPFLGGGALFFYLFRRDRIKAAILNDYNNELIECYKVVQNNVEALIAELLLYPNDKKFFYKIRNLDREPFFKKVSNTEKAARTIYLNKTCFNGLYRVNGSGQFNVPFGRNHNPQICDRKNLYSVNRSLSKIKLISGDFEIAVKNANKHDFVYFDPPYIPISSTSNFTKYTENGFTEDEQVRLAKVFGDLDKKGVFVLLSNSAAPQVKILYKNYKIVEVSANRFFNSKPKGRGKIGEVVVKNY